MASADPMIDRAVAVLAAIGGRRVVPRDERILVQRLAAADDTIAGAVDDGRLDAREALRVAREAHLLHRLLARRLDRDAAADTDDVLAKAARRLCDEFGFDRAMTFAVGRNTLVPVRTEFVERERWAAQVHACALAAPPELDRAIHESSVVLGRRSVVVDDAQNAPGSWKPVVVPLATRSYVAAPVVLDGATVGTIHGDRWFCGRDVDDADRDLIGLVAAELSRGLAARSGDPIGRLTPRQRQVLELVAAGHTNRSIAAALTVSNETVKSHVGNILRVLGVATRAEAVGRAYDLDRPS